MSSTVDDEQHAPVPDRANGPVEDLGPSRAFTWWGVGGYLITTAVLVAATLATTGGTLVYLIDDPAIHLSIAETLAESGTWGVVPGEFQSASSSPVWTLALSGFRVVLPFAFNAAPLLLNIVASLAVIWILGSHQRFLRPGRQRPLDGPAVVVVAVIFLFLPALTLLGMEHIAHMALVLAVVVLWCRDDDHRGRAPAWLPYLLLGIATLVRFETAFVAAGLAVAIVAGTAPRASLNSMRQRFQTAALVLASSAIPLVAFALFNRAMGQGWLPNSVLAKGQGISGSSESSFDPLDILDRLTTDPLLTGLALLALVGVVAGWGARRYVFPAVTFLVATAIHITIASVGWYERYQAYLIALGMLVVLDMAAQLIPEDRWRGSRAATLRPALLVLTLLMLSAIKISLTWEVPRGVADTYKQRYQAGIFLDRYYSGESIATGELGYISLAHDGPITDFFGLADFEVLEERRSQDQNVPAEYWEQLARDRDFDVAAVYPLTLLFDTPEDWILVGEWKLEGPTVTAFQDTFQFWATTPEEVAPLQEHLREFEPEMPDGTSLVLQEHATYRAELLGGE